DSGHATMEAWRSRHRHRRRFARLAPDRAHALSRYHAAAAAPTNLIKHHAVDLDVPIACGEVPVYPGDIVVGGDEGVAVTPQHNAEEVAEEAFEQTAFEDFVQEKVAQGRSIFGIYPPGPEAREEFKRWRAANRR